MDILEILKARASIQDVTRAIKSAGVPDQITQEPFDYDSSHYWRLCHLDGSEPAATDLLDYALDLNYMELQADLLRHLTPILLSAWKKDLFEGDKAGYGGFVEHFWPALLGGRALPEIYSQVERDAFIAYMRNTILDRLDAEESLHFSGMGTSPYRWVEALVSYGALFSDFELLWNEWWQMKTSGHAVAAFQYASALMYEENKNPVFEPWTPDKGGGPPSLWNCAGFMFNVGWKKENLDFLKRTLNANYFERKLKLAHGKIRNEGAKKSAANIINDFSEQRIRLELRIEELPSLLTDVSRVEGFTI